MKRALASHSQTYSNFKLYIIDPNILFVSHTLKKKNENNWTWDVFFLGELVKINSSSVIFILFFNNVGFCVSGTVGLL